jgi:hypothetical protein
MNVSVENPTPPKRRRRWGWWVAGAVLVAIAGLVIWLVFFWGVMRKSWSEEVQIAAGEVIVVKRYMKLVKVYYEISHPGWQTRRNVLTLPDGVRFDSEDRLILIRLERGQPPVRWVLIASPVFCEEFNKYGRPKPDYIQFEYVDGQWRYRPIEPRLLGQPANLLLLDLGIPPSGLVTEADRQKWNSTSERVGRRYLEILGSSHQDECWTVDITNRR